MLEIIAEAGAAGMEAVGVGAGAGGIGLLWLVREILLARKGNGNSKPGEGPVCRQHGEALAAGQQRFDWLKEGLTRVEKKIELILDEVRRGRNHET